MNRKFNTLISVTVFMLIASMLGVSADTSERIRYYWMHLDQTSNQCPETFDYYPDGGMRIFYCHLKTLLDYKTVSKQAGKPVFVRGPHSHRKLNLTNKYDFGHYNPDFVAWLRDNAIPGAKDQAFRKLTHQIYNKYLKNRADIFHATYLRLMADPTFLEREKETYLAHLRDRTLPSYYHGSFFTFAGLAAQSEQYDGNVVSAAVCFWLRRSIDGTAPIFFEGLEKLRTTYQTPDRDQQQGG